MTGPRLKVFSAVFALAFGLACASKPVGVPQGQAIALPFIENDFTQALARARELGRPLFVEVWAPW